jgi:diacylglycerol kinase
MDKKNPDKDIKGIFSTVGYTLDGLRAAFNHEAWFRQEVMLT